MTRLRAVTHFGVQARRSLVEDAEELRKRYFRASRQEKGKMLAEFTQVTELQGKSAIRLLPRLRQPGVVKGRGRPAVYRDLISPLRDIWEASERLCSRRLSPFLPEMIRVLRQHDEQPIAVSTEWLTVVTVRKVSILIGSVRWTLPVAGQNA